jgi:murein DD-endopeptidase MepM/ murein hydrolase activator NlpD
MPPLTRQQLAARRATRRRRELRRDRRAIVSAAIPVVIVAVLALALGLSGGGATTEAAGPLASPVPPPELGSGARPPEIVIARADAIEIHVPVDPERVTAAAFPSGVELERSGPLDIHQAGRDDRTGPETAGLDVGAPAGTAVYAPVDGTIASVGDYLVSGKIEGYEVAITPSAAPSGLMLRVTHLEESDTGVRPNVGTPVRAGVTPLGRVRDFSTVARQELSEFTSDAGNHVHMELIRTEAGLIP